MRLYGLRLPSGHELNIIVILYSSVRQLRLKGLQALGSIILPILYYSFTIPLGKRGPRTLQEYIILGQRREELLTIS